MPVQTPKVIAMSFFLQSYINAQFNFLDNLEYMYEQSSSESETPGPFSRSFQVLEQDQELEEREEDRDRSGRENAEIGDDISIIVLSPFPFVCVCVCVCVCSSPPGSLTGSRISLVHEDMYDESYKGMYIICNTDARQSIICNRSS